MTRPLLTLGKDTNVCLPCWGACQDDYGLDECPERAVLEVNCAVHEAHDN